MAIELRYSPACKRQEFQVWPRELCKLNELGDGSVGRTPCGKRENSKKSLRVHCRSRVIAYQAVLWVLDRA